MRKKKAETKPVIHSVKYNFIMNFILTASSFIFPLITFPYVSRVLHVTGNGKVAYAASIANYFMMVASLGIPTYGVRACAKLRDNREEMSRAAQEILIINLVATALTTAVYVVALFTVPAFKEDKPLYLIEGINIVLNMFGVNWIFQALEEYDYITFRNILFKAISIVLMFVFVHQEADYRIYALITVMASVGANILNFIRLRSIITFKRFNHYEFRRHLKPIFVLFAQSVTVSIYTNLDTVMLGAMKNANEVGLYTAAVKVKTILMSVVSSLSGVLLPRMSYYVKNNMKSEFERLMETALRAVLFMSIPLTVYFVLYASETLQFLAGSEYLPGAHAMQLITIAVIPIGITGVLGIQVLTPMGLEKDVLYSVILGAVTDFVLNLFLIRQWGAAGASLATTIAEIAVLIVQLYYCRQYFNHIGKGLHLGYYCLDTSVAAAAAACVKFLALPSFFALVLSALVFFGIYALLLILEKDEMMYKALDNKITGRLLRR